VFGIGLTISVEAVIAVFLTMSKKHETIPVSLFSAYCWVESKFYFTAESKKSFNCGLKVKDE